MLILLILYSKTFNNKYISELIYQIYHLIDITSSAEALKIEKDSRSYIVKSVSNNLYIYDWKYYNLHDDCETYDKVTIEYNTEKDKDINEQVYSVTKKSYSKQDYDKCSKWDGFIETILYNLRRIQTNFIVRMNKIGWNVSVVVEN